MDPRNELRQARDAAGLSKSGLADKAGLNKNSLHNMDDPDWNPTADTITKLWMALAKVATNG